jgi:hypothetical protein
MHATFFAHPILHDLFSQMYLMKNLDFITNIDSNNISQKYILISYNLRLSKQPVPNRHERNALRLGVWSKYIRTTRGNH